MRLLIIILLVFSSSLFANKLEDQIATANNYKKFSQAHYQLNDFFHENLDYSEAVEMRIFSYNAGMLSLAMVAVPKYEQRAPFLMEMLDSVDFDILSLQEIWNDSERAAIEKFAKDNNYYVYSGTEKNQKKHGLYILINRDLVEGKVKFSEYIYKKQAWYEPIVGYKKGALKAEFTLSNGKKMFYLNTHLTAVAKKIRDVQAQELIKKVKPKSDYIVFTGDLNNTPFMKEQVYWPLVQHYKFLDAHLAKYPEEPGYTYDTILNPIARFIGEAEESRQRIDYIFLGRSNDSAGYYVRDSGLLFTEDLPQEACSIKGKACKLSDHFGMAAWLYLY